MTSQQRTMRDAFTDDLAQYDHVFEGPATLATDAREPAEVWARVYFRLADPHDRFGQMEAPWPILSMGLSRPEFRIHVAPELLDRPPEQQPPTSPPPTSPPPFLRPGPPGAQQHLGLSFALNGAAETFERLRLLELQPVLLMDQPATWDALLGTP